MRALDGGRTIERAASVYGEVMRRPCGTHATAVRREGRGMEIGLLIRYGKLVPGREAQAIELFREAGQY